MFRPLEVYAVLEFAVMVSLHLVGSQNCSTREPSLGDLMIRRHDLAVVVYYTDGIQSPAWIPICTEKAGSNVYGVICRQRGYNDFTAITSHDSGRSSGISHHIEQESDDKFCLVVDCSESSTSHILRCDPSLCFDCNTHTVIKNSSFTCETPLTSSPYDGQLYLCPPNDFPTDTCTVSTGLVMINTYKQWRGINQNSSHHRLGSHEADSICRQLGFTNAVTNSARTVNSTQQAYSFCYNNSVSVHALLTTQELSCESSEGCLGCCFEFPSRQDDFCSECNNSTDIVISCTFDPTAVQQEETTCDKSRGKLSCNGQELTVIEWALIGTSSFFALCFFIVSVTLVATWCILQRRHRRQYERLQLDLRNRNGGGGGGGGGDELAGQANGHQPPAQ